MKPLSLPEQFTLLILKDKGSIFPNLYYSPKFHYGLSGTILLELIFKQGLIAKDTSIFTVNQNAKITTPYIKELLGKVSKGKIKEASPIDWIKSFAIHSNFIKKNILQNLADGDIISPKPVKFLSFKIATSWQWSNKSSKENLKKQVYQALSSLQTEDINILMLLAVIKATKTIGKIFSELDKKEQAILNENLSKIFENEHFTKTLSALIQEAIWEQMDKMSELMDSLSDAIDAIGDAADSGSSDGGSDGGGGDGGGGGD
jgi:Golgi phosphoprotein 3 (GPP34)